MLRLISLGVALFAVCCSSRYVRPKLSGEEEADLGAILPYIYGFLPEIYSYVLETDSAIEKHVVDMAEEYGIFAEDPYDVVNFTGPSESCVECRAFVGLLLRGVESQNYTEFTETFMDLCALVVNASDGDLGIPEYICPGIAENYLADAYYVLTMTEKNQTDICVQWNECIYTDFDPPLSEETLVCKPPPIPSPAAYTHPKPRHHGNLNGTIRVAHLTDIHVDTEYDVGSPVHCGMPSCCRDLYPGQGEAGYWGEFPCNQPISTSDVMLQTLAGIGVDYIAYTGDSPPHFPWLVTYDEVLASSAAIVDSFQRNIPGVNVYYALGNHDIHPTNLYYHNRTYAQRGDVDQAALWGPLAGFGPEQYNTFEDAAYYTILLQPGLRIVTYNSNFGWLENFYSLLEDDFPDYERMKVFLESTLESARTNGERVILLAHHPTGQSQGHNEHSCYITDLHARYGDVIILHLSGHKHGDLYRLVRDIQTGETRGVQISSPAGGLHTDRNPSLRIFYLDPDTFDVLDADTYRINFTLVEGVPDDSVVPVLELGYRFTEEYDMVDLSPQSFEDFILRMETDDDLFDKHWWNEATASPGKHDPCASECRTEELCQMQNTAYPGYLVCMGEI